MYCMKSRCTEPLDISQMLHLSVVNYFSLLFLRSVNAYDLWIQMHVMFFIVSDFTALESNSITKNNLGLT